MGNSVGARNIPLARRFFWLIFQISACIVILLCVLLVLARKPITRVFTEEPEIIDLALPSLTLMAFNSVFSDTGYFLLGVIQSLGLQAKAMIYSVVLAYLVGLPLSIILGFKADMGLFGLYLGYSIKEFLNFVCFFCLVMCKDWHKLADEAKDRILEHEKEIIERSVVVNLKDDDDY